MPEITKIAERVKFWEEQDRINKTVIPRLLKNHDLIEQLAKQQALYSGHVAGMESRMSKLETTLSNQNAFPKRVFVLALIAIVLSAASLLISVIR